MIKRLAPAETAALWTWLQTQPSKWWLAGTPFGPRFGWPQIFEADNWHCVYCGCDLAESEDVLAESTEEHLVPQSVFAVGGANADVGDNVAACCSSCNGLKGPAVPEIKSPEWKTREAYVKAMRVYIDDERTKRAAKYRAHAFKARAARIWSSTNSRQKDYL